MRVLRQSSKLVRGCDTRPARGELILVSVQDPSLPFSCVSHLQHPVLRTNLAQQPWRRRLSFVLMAYSPYGLPLAALVSPRPRCTLPVSPGRPGTSTATGNRQERTCVRSAEHGAGDAAI